MFFCLSCKYRVLFCLFLSVFLFTACSSSKKTIRSKHGYYKDDGPPSNSNTDFDKLPDAIPRIEPYIRSSLKPYRANGKTYTPITHNRPFKQRGIGSWYGKKFHGKKTASGEIYDMNKMTAAHPTLPLPSYARVTHIKSGRQVIVRINDRGPFHRNRIIDLSYAAASKLNYMSKGSDLLEVERLLPEDIKRGGKKNVVKKNDEKKSETHPVKESVYDSIFDPSASPVVSAPVKTSAKKYYLQLGIFSKEENAEELQKLLEESFSYAVKLEEENGVFRVLSGPFSSQEEAVNLKEEIQTDFHIEPIIFAR